MNVKHVAALMFPSKHFVCVCVGIPFKEDNKLIAV